MTMDCFKPECNTTEGLRYNAMAQGIPSTRYVDMMELSWFCMVPAGRSPMSFRLLESLQAGCLPVFLADPDAPEWIPPLIEYVPWEEFLVYACVPKWEHWTERIMWGVLDHPDCPSVPEEEIGLWPRRKVPVRQLARVLRSIPIHERLRRRELMLRFYYRYLRTLATAPQSRRHAEMVRPMLLALRILFERIHLT
jgi:Exostosin family